MLLQYNQHQGTKHLTKHVTAVIHTGLPLRLLKFKNDIWLLGRLKGARHNIYEVVRILQALSWQRVIQLINSRESHSGCTYWQRTRNPKTTSFSGARLTVARAAKVYAGGYVTQQDARA